MLRWEICWKMIDTRFSESGLGERTFIIVSIPGAKRSKMRPLSKELKKCFVSHLFFNALVALNVASYFCSIIVSSLLLGGEFFASRRFWCAAFILLFILFYLTHILSNSGRSAWFSFCVKALNRAKVARHPFSNRSFLRWKHPVRVGSRF